MDRVFSLAGRLRSLRVILLVVATAAMLPSIGIISYSGLEAWEQERLSTHETTLREVQNLASVQERLTATTRQMLSVLALLPAVRDRRVEDCTALFRQLVALNPVFDNLLLTDARGMVLASALPFDGVNLADRKHVSDALASRDFSSGEYIVSRTSGEPTFPFALPVLSAEGVEGILTATVNLTHLGGLFSHAKVADGGFMGIVDHQGRRLFRTPFGDRRFGLGRPISDAVWAGIQGKGDSDTIIARTTGGSSHVVAFRKLRLQPDMPAYMMLIVGVPERLVGAAALARTGRDIGIVAAIGGFSLLLAWAIGRWAIVAKVDMLLRATRRFAAGDFDTPTGLGQDGSEFGLLASAMEAMAAARKKAQEALRQTEAKFQRVVAKAPLPLSLMNDRGEIVFLNERFIQDLGYTIADTPTFDDWWSHARPPEDGHDVVSWADRFRGAAQRNVDVGPHECRVRCKDGSERVLELSVIVLDDGFLATFVDVTARRRAEDALRESEGRLKAVVDNAPFSIMLKDLDGRYLLVNTVLARRLGREASDLIGRDVRDLVDRRWGDEIAARDEEALKSGTAVWHEVEITERDGVRRTYLVNRFPVFGASGAVVALGGVSTDISERKRFEKELVEAKLQAELGSRAKSEFLANMSHELRTPLNSVLGFSEIMMMELFGPLGNPRYIEYAGHIHEGAALLLRIISDILDLSRIEAGVVAMDEQPLDAADLVAAVTRLLSERAGWKKIAFSSAVEQELPPFPGDALRVKQILLNLAGNAIKFTPPHGKVTIAARRGPSGELLFEVSDTGVGMAPADIVTALQPFGQVAGAQQRDQPGTGLGLPLARSLTELHGGTLEIASEIGRGTTVTVRFPLKREAAPLDLTAESCPA